MLCEIALTVSESKRLIAKGVAALPAVKKALADGTVAIATGSTNAYVVEEITGQAIDKNKYMTGATLPAGVSRKGLLSRELPDVVLKQGKRVENAASTDAITEMGVGDVFMKGANALHYETRRAGVLIGHPTGGTVGATLGTIIARRITLVIPVGLEKSVAQPLEEAFTFLRSDAEASGNVPALWPLNGEIVTEIEALKVLTGVDAVQTGAGGLAGAEGAVWLALRGDKKQVDAATRLVESIQGEPPFVSAP